MKYLNKIFRLIVMALFAIAMGACSDDNDAAVDGLFSPHMVSNYPVVEGNSIKYIWYDITTADTYKVQISYDEEFTTIIQEDEIDKPTYIARDLKYGTTVYARFMAESASGLKSIWTVVKSQTDERVFDHILHDIDMAEVTDCSVMLRWDVSDKNPADMIMVRNLDAEEDAVTEITLSEEDFLKGEYLLDDLLSSTNYEICLYNNKAESIEDRPYNPVTFKTKGADILHEIDNAGITDSSIRISWDINEKYPADRIRYNEVGGEIMEIQLTEEEFQNKAYVITGLKSSTVYEICMYNSATDRQYNVITATTGAAPIWKVPVDASPLAPGILFENNDITISSVFNAKTAESPRSICGKGFNGYVQLRVASAPSGTDMTGTQQNDCTPIIVEPNQNMKFTIFVRLQRQTDNGDGTVTFTVGGGKDALCFDQSEKKTIECVMVADNPNVTTIDGKNFISTESYEYFAKTFTLNAGTKYTIYARGTTVQLFGADYEVIK